MGHVVNYNVAILFFRHEVVQFSPTDYKLERFGFICFKKNAGILSNEYQLLKSRSL